MYDLILKNCNIVNEGSIFESDIAIKNSRIELISKEIDSESKKVTDIDGKYVIPGLIDDQVHFREPGLTHKGEIATESKAGLAGGVTSYFEMPNVNPTTTTNENLTKKFELASTRSLSNYSFHLGGSNTNIEEIKKVDINQAAALKVFMGASTGEMLVDSIDALDDIFNYSPLIVVTHCEDPQRVTDNEKLFFEKYGNDLSAEHHHLIRDVESCYLSSSLAVDLAKKYDSDLHVFHLTTEKEMELFTAGKIDGKKITAEVCVHHMYFNESRYADLGNQIKCNPSIKYESDRLALINALLTDKIDIIATDHAPHTWEEKNQSYSKAPAGLPLVQHGMQILMDFYHQDIL
ncbi:MAG: dihydroorotase, partial [SAR86 cluster bacterium]